MKRKVKPINSILLFIIMMTFGCSPDSLEFARPDNLAGTISQQLEQMGTFKYYLKALNQTPYSAPLLKGGSFTVFVPTDAAFEKFMKAENYANFEAIPQERILAIVQNSIIDSAWNTTTLSYTYNSFYQSLGLRKRTQYRDPIIEIDAADYPNIYVPLLPGKYKIDTSIGRMKTTAYFLPWFFDWDRGYADRVDYDYMFTGETFTANPDEMKVYEANVSEANIIAENGIIYALDNVIEPRKNLYQNLTSPEYGGKYTLFKKLLERFASFKSQGLVLNTATGVQEEVFNLSFLTGILNNYLPFDTNDENHPKLTANIDATVSQATGLIVPSNQALLDYLNGNSILGEFYTSYDAMPLDVLGKFLGSHFFASFSDLGPSKAGQSFNVGQELIDFKQSDAVDKKFCSNGFFVGTNKVYTNTSFSTILGPLLLDQNYSIMLKAVKDLGIDNALLGKGVKFSVFGVRNDQFIDVADPNNATRRITVLSWEPDLSKIYMQVTGDPVAANNRVYPSLTAPTTADITYVSTTLKDIVLNQIVEKEVDVNSGNYYQTKSGDFILASGGINISGGGNTASGQPAKILSVKTTDNGKFYKMSTFIERPRVFPYGALLANSSTFSLFLDVLKSADAILDIPLVTTDKLVSFVNNAKTYTLLAPNNAAVTQAIADKVIPNPATTYLATLTPLELATAKRDLLNFAKLHFIQQAVPTDGKIAGTYPTMFYDKVIDFVPVYKTFTIANNFATKSLTIRNPTTNAVITTTATKTNIFSKAVVIHEIDNYLK